MNTPYVSIIIPARNAEKTIKKCLDSVLNLDYKNYEVIVIDDGSEDRTPEILENYKDKIKIIKNIKALGPSQSRNMAVKEAKGEYLAFTDADCFVDKSWLTELISGFKESKIVSVGGIQEIPKDETEFGRKVSEFFKKIGFISDYMHIAKRKESVEVNHNPSCNVMYRKDIFLEENGFLENLWPGEDVELDYRLRKKGYKIIFNPKAIVYHYRPSNLKSFLKMMYRYGWAQGFLVKKYGIFRKIQILPFLTLGIFLCFCIALFYMNIYLLLFFIFIFLFLILYFKFDLYILPVFLSWHYGFLNGIFFKENNLHKYEDKDD